MRAYSDNEDLALLSGINPDRVVMVTWILAGTLACIAGTLYGLDKSFKPFTYFHLLLPIFAAAIVGGIGQPVGAILGGYVVAFSEVMATYAYKKFFKYLLPDDMAPSTLMQFLSTDYKFAVSFIILVLVLLIRPTGIFRGFENIGTDYAMIMAILGGDDAGGGVLWAPEVIIDAQEHGLILGENGALYDSKKGQSLPDGIAPMPVMDEDALARIKEPSVDEVVSDYVARYLDMMALAKQGPVDVISPTGLLRDKPGFSVDFITRGSLSEEMYQTDAHEIIMITEGHWRLTLADGSLSLAKGDVAAIPPHLRHALTPAMSGEASLYRVTSNEDAAGPTWVEWQTEH